MAITIDGQERRIALALSGGGFRAAAFHLGVMRKLQSLGLLARAVAASSAFPCVFLPLRIDRPEYETAAQVDHATLSDGGVHDNMGVNRTLRSHGGALVESRIKGYAPELLA